MRIAFFAESFPKQSETFILNQVLNTLEMGHDVDVYAIQPIANERPIASYIPDASLRDRLRIFYLQELRPQNIQHQNVLCLWQVPKFIRTYGLTNIRQVVHHSLTLPYAKYDLIHAHFGTSARRVALLKNLGVIEGPLIATFHGFDVHTIPRNHPLSYYKIVFETAEAITVGSQFMWDKLLWMGAPRQKLHLLPMPIDLQRFAYRTPQESPDTISFLSIGRLIDWKAHRHAIEAFALVKDSLPAWHYIIVGEGNERAGLEKLIHENDLSSHITLAGQRTSDEVYDYLHRSDILIHPSVQGRLGSIESQGVVLAEAAAVGLPIIATRAGGIPDTVIDEHNGYLVEQANIPQLAQTIQTLATSPKKWPQMSTNGRALVEERFNQHTIDAKRLALYRRISTAS